MVNNNINMITKYPDNTSYAIIDPVITEFTFKINSYEDLWHLNQITDAYKHNNIKPIITIPNLIDAQADDRFDDNQSFGLKLVCDFLNKMHATFKIFHPHNSQIVKSLIDNVEIIDNHKFISLVLHQLGYGDELGKDENLILMSLDAGGYKPLMKLADKIKWKGETYSASKARKWLNGKSTLNQTLDKQDFEGKDILIIDDLLIGGGSMKGLSKMLKERNCGKLYCAVSHITVQNLGEDPVTNYFDTVFTTNSKFDEYWYWNEGGSETNCKNLQIIKSF